MSINNFQPISNLIFKTLLLIFFVAPDHVFATAPAALELIQLDAKNSLSLSLSEADAESEIETVDKKKDKIELNSKFYLSLLIDLFFVGLIIVLVYYPNYKKMDTIFTFILFNVVIFLLTFVLNKVKISMGAAFGLFAVFSMLRYRTAGIGMKDMTYLFIFIALGLISGIQLEFHELGIIAAVIFIVALVFDTKLILRKRESSNTLRYEKIEMVKPNKRDALIKELCDRTGLDIHRITLNDLDYLKDTVMITYYYYE